MYDYASFKYFCLLNNLLNNKNDNCKSKVFSSLIIESLLLSRKSVIKSSQISSRFVRTLRWYQINVVNLSERLGGKS